MEVLWTYFGRIWWNVGLRFKQSLLTTILNTWPFCQGVSREPPVLALFRIKDRLYVVGRSKDLGYLSFANDIFEKFALVISRSDLRDINIIRNLT